MNIDIVKRDRLRLKRSANKLLLEINQSNLVPDRLLNRYAECVTLFNDLGKDLEMIRIDDGLDINHGKDDKRRIIFGGHSGHGKDEVCLMMSKVYTARSSSLVAIETPETKIFETFKEKYGYQTTQEVYENRDKHRQELYLMIVAYNTPDLARLGKQLFSQYDFYCGIRNIDELMALKEIGEYDYFVWVDAERRLGTKERNSNSIDISHADYVLDNNGTKSDLAKNIDKMMRHIGGQKVYLTGTV